MDYLNTDDIEGYLSSLPQFQIISIKGILYSREAPISLQDWTRLDGRGVIFISSAALASLVDDWDDVLEITYQKPPALKPAMVFNPGRIRDLDELTAKDIMKIIKNYRKTGVMTPYEQRRLNKASESLRRSSGQV